MIDDDPARRSPAEVGTGRVYNTFCSAAIDLPALGRISKIG